MPDTIQELIDTIDESIEADGTPEGDEVGGTHIRALLTDQSQPGSSRPHFRRDEPPLRLGDHELRLWSADAAVLAPTDNVYTGNNGERYVFPSARQAARLSLAAAGIPPKYLRPLRHFTGYRLELIQTPSRREQQAWRDTLFPRPNHRTSLPVRILEMMIDAINLSRPERFWARDGESIQPEALNDEGYELAEVDWDRDRHRVRELDWEGNDDEPNWEQIY